MLVADAISTFIGLNMPLGLIEVNPTIAMLYDIGLMSVMVFHCLSVTASLAYALLMYFVSFRSKLPSWSKKIAAASYFTFAGLLSMVPLHNVSVIFCQVIIRAEVFWKYYMLFSSYLPIGFSLVLTLYLDYLATRIS